MVTFLNSEQIAQVLTPQLCLDALEEAYADLSDRAAVSMLGREVVMTRLADRTFPNADPGKAYYTLEIQSGLMPRYGVGAMRLKSDMVYFAETETGIRRDKIPVATGQQYCGLIMLFSIERVEPVAVMPDGLIQRLRVGATSALGAKYLARPDAKTAGILGAGFQASAQLMTLRLVRQIDRVKVFSPTRSRREAFAAEMREQLGIDVVAVDSAADAARGADILQSATNSRTPTIDPSIVRPGMHIGVIGVAEAHEGVVQRADVLASSSRKHHSGSHFAIANGSAADIYEPEFLHGWWKDEALMDSFVMLGDVMRRRAQGRRTSSDITFYISGGGALQFAAVGAKVLEAARARGLGTDVPVEWFLQPYHP